MLRPLALGLSCVVTLMCFMGFWMNSRLDAGNQKDRVDLVIQRIEDVTKRLEQVAASAHRLERAAVAAASQTPRASALLPETPKDFAPHPALKKQYIYKKKTTPGTGSSFDACGQAEMLRKDAERLLHELQQSKNNRQGASKCTRAEDCDPETFPCCSMSSGYCGAGQAHCLHRVDARDRFGGKVRFERLHAFRAFSALCSTMEDSMHQDDIEEVVAAGIKVFGSARPLMAAIRRTRFSATDFAGKPVRLLSDARDVSFGDLILPEAKGDSYKLRTLGLNPGDVAIDVGGHVGLVALYLAKVLGVRVFTIEASPINYFYNLWNQRINGMKASEVKVFHAAMTDFVGAIKVQVRDGSSMNSGIASLQNGGAGGGVDVATVTLVGLMRDYNLGTVRFLKMDCEGCEYMAIPQVLKENLWDSFEYVRGEIHPALTRGVDSSAKTLTDKLLCNGKACLWGCRTRCSPAGPK